MMSRREFLRLLGTGALVVGLIDSPLISPLEKVVSSAFAQTIPKDYDHQVPNWREISKGLYFARVDIYNKGKKVDTVAVSKINPEFNQIRVFNSYEGPENYELLTIEDWRDRTNATIMFNSAQYMGRPYASPCALIMCDGRKKGPKFNKTARGMLVAEPTDEKLPKANLLDFDFDHFDPDTTKYTQGVQHWPILLDKNGNIKVKRTDWLANRTVVSKDREGDIVVFTTEGGYFTLYEFGRFLKDSNFNIECAMNMDGGYEAEMIVKSKDFNYVTYGQFETYGPMHNASIPGARCRIPGVIGVFPRK